LTELFQIGETTLAEANPNRLVAEDELARLYFKDGQTEKALRLVEHVVKARGYTAANMYRISNAFKVEEDLLAQTDRDRLVSVLLLTRIYSAKGQTKDAIALLFKARLP
jgi:hypothetical protein